MRDKSTGRDCDPVFLPREMPVEANPMQMSLRQRRIVPIPITEKAIMRHRERRRDRQRKQNLARMEAGL